MLLVLGLAAYSEIRIHCTRAAKGIVQSQRTTNHKMVGINSVEQNRAALTL